MIADGSLDDPTHIGRKHQRSIFHAFAHPGL